MTYKEAVRLKSNKDSKFQESGLTYKVFVTPENNDNLVKYLTDVRSFFCQLTDEDAKKYAKNGQFTLHGLSYITNRPKILIKPL